MHSPARPPPQPGQATHGRFTPTLLLSTSAPVKYSARSQLGLPGPIFLLHPPGSACSSKVGIHSFMRCILGSLFAALETPSTARRDLGSSRAPEPPARDTLKYQGAPSHIMDPLFIIQPTCRALGQTQDAPYLSLYSCVCLQPAKILQTNTHSPKQGDTGSQMVPWTQPPTMAP